MLKVPFIATKEFMENPIICCNLIEDLVVSIKDHQTFETLKSVFHHVPLEGAETVWSIMEKVKNFGRFIKRSQSSKEQNHS